jgi:hypothetical protein
MMVVSHECAPIGDEVSQVVEAVDHSMLSAPRGDPSAGVTVDSTIPDRIFELASAIGTGGAQPVGAYRFDLEAGTWWWSDEVYTSELMLAHNHPDERTIDLPALETSCRAGRPFSYIHRILDANQDVRTLAVSGQGRLDDSNERVLEATGFFVDVSAVERATYQAEVSKALGEILVSRASIEQAKGILRLAYGLDNAAAFEVLRHNSNLANVKIRDLAEGLLQLAESGAMTTGNTHVINSFFSKAAQLMGTSTT